MNKIDIKSWRTGEILFSHEAENNTIKLTVEEAVRKGVGLSGADLRVD